MAYASTIFNQLLNFLPKDRFDHFVGQHEADRYVKKLTTWNQLTALLYAQATGKESLREIETGMSSHQNTWSHLGIESVARSTLSDANARRPHSIFEQLFYALLDRCHSVTPKNKFSFTNPLYTFDATTIRLCLSVFDWAKYTRRKGALKLHTLLGNSTDIPELVTITDGKTGDVTAAKMAELTKRLERGSIVVFDRAYMDYAWWYQMHEAGLFFVSRIKKNTNIQLLGQHATVTERDVVADLFVLIGEYRGLTTYPEKIRLVKVRDAKSGEIYSYLTNNLILSASQIAEVYKARWQVEVFFKWIKQNLKIKTFLGTSENAVMSQVWVAMIYYLLLVYIKFQTKFSRSLLELTRMLKEILLTRRPIIDLLSLTARNVIKLKDPPNPQMRLL